MRWTDVHTHLDKLEVTPSEALSNAAAVGIDRVITIGTCIEDLPVVLDLAQKHAPKVFCTLGIHPHDAETYSDEVEAFIRENAKNPRVVALGEMGLDYYYTKDEESKQIQRQVFKRQIDLAMELGLPIEVHTRDAEADTKKILEPYRGKLKGLLHCFTGSKDMADWAVEFGFHFSISGVVTFKNADDLRATVASIPLKHLHVETDAPFLAPVPHRGKKNEPSFMLNTAAKIAELHGVSLDQLGTQVELNAKYLFPKLL